MFQQLQCIHTGFFSFFMWVLFKEIQKAVYYAMRSFLQSLDVALLTFKWPGWVKKDDMLPCYSWQCEHNICSELCKEAMGWLQGEEMSYEFVVINPQAESRMDGRWYYEIVELRSYKL